MRDMGPVAFTLATMTAITFGPSLPSAAIMVVVGAGSVLLLVFGIGSLAWLGFSFLRMPRQRVNWRQGSSRPIDR